jgi:hypothetical protein
MATFFFTTSRLAFGVHPAYPVDTGALSSGVAQPEQEANHSLPPNAKVKNVWSCSFTPSYICMAWCFGMHHRQLYPYILIACHLHYHGQCWTWHIFWTQFTRSSLLEYPSTLNIQLPNRTDISLNMCNFSSLPLYKHLWFLFQFGNTTETGVSLFWVAICFLKRW